MGISKHQMVDLILERVGGGLPSDDLSVSRAAVIHLIPAAINYQVVADYRIERRLNKMDRLGDQTADLSAFVGTYAIDVQKDSSRGLYYVPIEGGLMDLPYGRAIESVFPEGAFDKAFVPIRSHVELVGVPQMLLSSQTYFWRETFGGDDRIYFSNISHVVKRVIARVAVSIDNFDFDDPLPAPDHILMQAMDMIVAWFTGERQLPEELVINERDDKR